MQRRASLQIRRPHLDEARAALESIVSEGHRASEVIESIRAMFKNVDQEKAPIDVTKLVRDMLGLMRGELRANDVSVETKLDDNLPDVRGNLVQLQQVILNLIRNAIEAMNSVTDRAGTADKICDSRAQECAYLGKGLRNGHRSKRCRPHLRFIFHDKTTRHGDGVVHMSVDHRRSSGPALGFIRHRSWCGF